jgi:hypothetical protein
MPKLSHHKLFVHDHLNARELSEIYLSEPTASGQLFLILESPKTKTNQQPMIDKVIATLANHFDSSSENDSEALLEELLQKLNQLLPELAENKIKNWLQNLDLVIGIMSQQNVFLASIGNIEAWLVHNNQLTQILDKNPDFNPAKIFTDIISGQLDAGDALVISTNALFDYVSQEKIKQTVKKYTPNAASHQFIQLLDTVPDFVTFNSLLIKSPGLNDLDTAKDAVSVTVESEDENVDQDKPLTVDYDAHKKRDKSPRPARTKLVFDKSALKNIKTFQKLAWIGQAIRLFFEILKKIFLNIFAYIKNAWLFLFSSKYRQDRESKLLQTSRQSISRKVSWFGQLNLKKKILIIGLIAVLLIFLQSLVFLTQKQATHKQEINYRQAIQAINTSLNEVEASLIYNDEKRAEDLLLNIQDMLDDLQASSPQEESEMATVQEQTARLLNKVRHINYVSSPLELFDLSALNQPKQIIQKDDTFYILDQENLYLLQEQDTQNLTSFTGGKTMASWPNENKLILSNDQEYVIFNLDNQQIESFSFTQSAGNTSVQDMSIYGNNLYVLDAINNQIFKYPERGESFSNGLAWLQEEISLADATSLTLDGDIYTMFNSGQILKFRKGQRETFNYHQPHPVIGSQAIIKTFADSDYLYIIDPDNQRVIILDKEGNIKDQYSSSKFDNLVDLAVDSEEKAIYLLNGNHLYLLAINE